jgi:hypothetical protein
VIHEFERGCTRASFTAVDDDEIRDVLSGFLFFVFAKLF